MDATLFTSPLFQNALEMVILSSAVENGIDQHLPRAWALGVDVENASTAWKETIYPTRLLEVMMSMQQESGDAVIHRYRELTARLSLQGVISRSCPSLTRDQTAFAENLIREQLRALVFSVEPMDKSFDLEAFERMTSQDFWSFYDRHVLFGIVQNALAFVIEKLARDFPSKTATTYGIEPPAFLRFIENTAFMHAMVVLRMVQLEHECPTFVYLKDPPKDPATFELDNLNLEEIASGYLKYVQKERADEFLGMLIDLRTRRKKEILELPVVPLSLDLGSRNESRLAELEAAGPMLNLAAFH